MYYGRKKGIIIGIIVAILVILIAIAGVFVVLKTDVFKSNKTLFWKYMDNALADTKILENAQLEDVEKLKEQKPYTINGELTASSTNKEINNILEKIKLSIDAQTDKTNKYSHLNSEIEYANTKFFNLEYANDDDIYALKSDEIVTAYLGIRNENIKVLLQKMGIQDISNFLDKIESPNYNELFKISDEELNHIKETYMPVIEASISDNSYSKQTEAVIEKDGVSYNTTSYRLDLTDEQISSILVNILNTLKTDSITLNLIATKAKMVGADDKYTTVDGINDAIDDIIDEIQDAEYTATSLVVYSYQGETIATEIIERNKQKTTLYRDNEKIRMVTENLSADAEYDTLNLEIVNKATSTQSNITIKQDIDDRISIVIDIVNTGSATQNSLDTNCNVSITIDDETYEFEYNQTLEFVDELESMEKLDQTNCAILNDYSQEDLNSLMVALLNQIVSVYNQKAQVLGLVPATPDEPVQDDVMQEVTEQ